MCSCIKPPSPTKFLSWPIHGTLLIGKHWYKAEKAKTKNVALLHDKKRNTCKMQMSFLNDESKAKWQKERQGDFIKLNEFKHQWMKMIPKTEFIYILKSNLKPHAKNSLLVQANKDILLNKTVMQLNRIFGIIFLGWSLFYSEIFNFVALTCFFHFAVDSWPNVDICNLLKRFFYCAKEPHLLF